MLFFELESLKKKLVQLSLFKKTAQVLKNATVWILSFIECES